MDCWTLGSSKSWLVIAALPALKPNNSSDGKGSANAQADQHHSQIHRHGNPRLLAPQRPSSVNATQNFWQAGRHSWIDRAQQPMGRPGISRWFV